MIDLAQLSPDMLRQLAQEWDPTPFLQAAEQPIAPGGAMDMTGSAAYPTGAMPAQGMDYASIFGNAPKMGGLSPFPAQMMQGMQTPPARVAPAPAAQPQKGQIPNLNLGRGLKPVPTLDQLLRGGG